MLQSADLYTPDPTSSQLTKLELMHGKPEEICCLAVDEISFVTGAEVKHLSDRYAQWLGLEVREDLPFGGCPAILMGHFFQLPAPRVSPLLAGRLRRRQRRRQRLDVVSGPRASRSAVKGQRGRLAFLAPRVARL